MTDTIEVTAPMTAEEKRARMYEMLDGYTDEQIEKLYPQFEAMLAAQIVNGVINDVEWKYGEYVDLPPEKWPLTDGPIDGALERHENEIVTNRTMFERLEADQQEFLHPVEALRYVKRNKIKHPIVVLFWIGEGQNRQLCFLCVDVYDDGGLRLRLRRDALYGYWYQRVRFLVRPRKLPE